MKISYNPKSSQAAITPQTAANDDIIFDLYASKLWAKGVRIGADWADISSKPSSLKNPHALTISLNGTSQGPYDGSTTKNINITPNSIGASPSSHTHPYLPLSGGTVTGTLTLSNSSVHIGTDTTELFRVYSNTGYKNGLSIFSIDNRTYINAKPYGSGITNALYLRTYNQGAVDALILAANGNATFIGSVTASSFIGNASSATKLTSSAGNAALPIYFSDGKPVACTASQIFSNLSNSGNNLSITVAGQNRTLTVGYANNADTVDGYHIANESKQVYKNYYTVDNPAGAWILIKFPAYNGYNEIVTISGRGDNKRSHCVVHCGSRNQGIWGYQSEYNGIVVSKIRWREVDSGKFAIVALIDGGITDLMVKATNALEISKTTEDNAAFTINSNFFSSGGVFYGNVPSATKLQTPRNLWGNSFDGTKDINGSIVFPAIGDTATSNKISWSGSSDGADIYYQTTGLDQGNLVLNVKDDTNAYIQLALNGVFKSHFDVANSYWTGRSALADKWTTARTFTIGNTAKNVDGSGNVSWSLAEIGASPSGHNHDNIYIKKVGDMPVYNDIIISPTNLSEEGIDGGGGIHVKGFTGTPFQLWLHDTGNVWYKKTRDGAWKKMDAGHADTAGSVAWNNVTGKPSSFTPSAHTHAWNSLTHSSTIENQAILTNGEANGWKLQTLNIANWDNAANNAHSHANKSVLDGITSGLVTNWNTAYNFVNTITGEDADKVINKWEEIVNFLAGITEDNKLNTLLNSKLSIQQLSAKDILTTKTNNALFWVNTIGTASSITTGPFTDHPYALLSVTNYNQNTENSKFFYRSRLAFNSAGDIKVASCHHENEYKQDETWYNVLTSKNSGISGSTIKLNGTSITVYSSSTADGKYVKKSGDTMSGTLNFANNTWNNVGDDVAIGDHNVAGCLGIKGRTAGPGLAFYNSSNTLLSKLVGTANQFQRVSGDNVFNILDNSTTHINDNTITINGTSLTVSKSDHTHDNKYLRLDGSSTMTGQIKSSYSAGTWIVGLTNAILKATSNGYNSLICAPIKSGNVCISAWGAEDKLNFGYAKKDKTENNFDTRMYWDAPNNNLHADAFTGHLYGTADNATNSDKLDGYHANDLLTALSNSNRGISLTIGGTTKSLSNISVGDADTVDGVHASAFTRIVGRYFINTDGTAPYRYIHLFRIANSMGYSTVDCEIDLRTRHHSAKLEIRIATPQYPYGENGSSISIIKKVINGRSCNLWVLKTVQSSNYNYYDIYYESGSYNFGGYDIILRGHNGTLVFEHKGTKLDALPSNTSVVNNQWVMWNDIAGKPTALKNPHTIKFKNTANAVITYDGSSDVDLTGGINYANSAGSATKVIVNQHTANDINYPLVWSNQNNANNTTENQLYKSWQDLYYNPKNKRLFVRGSVNTANINATGTVTSAGFKHSGVTENADQYVLTAGGGYTFLNQASNELAHEFSKDITVTSEWTDIEDFYGGNQNFLTQPGTYIVQVYYNDNSADGMYEGYFSGIMSWFTGTTNSNNADEIVLHRVGHAYANTIYLRTRESLESETNPYTKLQISANTTLKQHTYKFKFKRIC